MVDRADQGSVTEPARRSISAELRRSWSNALVKNTSAQVANQILSVAIGVVTFSLASRALGAQQYGALATALTVSGFAAIALDGGIDTFVIRRLAATRDANPRSARAQELVSDAVLARLALGLVAVAGALAASVLFGYARLVLIGVLLLSLATAAGGIGMLPLDIYQAGRDMIPATIIGALGRMFSGLLVVALFATGSLGLGAMYATVIAGTLGTILGTAAWLRRSGFTLRVPSAARARALQRAAFPLAVWIVLGQVVHRADIVILSAVPLQPSMGLTNESAVGIYTAAYKMYDLSIGLPGFLVATILPTMAALFAVDTSRFARYFAAWVAKATGLGILAAMVIGVLGGPAVVLLAGSGFGLSAPLVPVLALAIPFAYGTSVLYAGLVTSDRLRGLVGLYAFAAVFNITLNLILAPRFAFWSAAWLTVITQILLFIGMTMLMKGYWLAVP